MKILKSSSFPNSKSVSRENGDVPAGHITIDRSKIEARMAACKIKTQEALAHEIAVSRAVINRMLNDGYVLPEHLDDIAVVLKTSIESLRPMSTYQEAQELAAIIPAPRDWSIVEFQSPFVIAANGVSYCIAKLQSELVASKSSRGKFYNLVNVVPSKQVSLRERLIRHPSVCEMLKDSKFVARNCDIRRLAEETAWWVLDEWVADETLADWLEGEITPTQAAIKKIGKEILLGLTDLHAAKVVMRELAPERVLISKSDLHCTLTDFELAKLFEGNPSVSGDWKTQSPYRAPEIVDGEPDVRSDIYSWAIIVIEMLTGDPNAKSDLIAKSIADKSLSTALVTCIDPRVSKRPVSVAAIIETWDKWPAKD